MQGFIMGFVVGVISLTTLSHLPPLAYSWWLIAVPLFFLRFPKLRIFTGILSGFLWASLQANLLISPLFPASLEKQDLLIQGKIIDIPSTSGRSLRFMLKPEQWAIPEPLPDRIQLSWYNNAPELLAGETWQLLVRLKRPHGFNNPGSQDREKLFFSRGVGAAGYVRKSPDNKRMQPQGFGLNPLRHKLARHISSLLGENEMKGLVLALTLGLRSDISKSQWESFTTTGTSHLIAISGLHIGLVSGFFYGFVVFLWKKSLRLCHRLPAQKAGAIAAAFSGLIYAAMAGFSVPTQRAMIMLAVIVVAMLSNRSVRRSHILLLALFLVLLVDSMSILSPGLWLSFAAVATILWMLKQHRNEKKWRQFIRIQWFISLGLLPLTVWFFQRASLVSPFANLIAVPLTGFFIVPLLLVGVLVSLIYAPLGKLILYLPVTALEAMGVMLGWMQQLPAASASFSEPSLIVLILAVVGMILLLGTSFFGSRIVAILLILPLVFNRPATPAAGDFKVEVLDVGQGLSVVITTENHAMVYDTGPKFSQTFNAGDAVLIPYLRAKGLADIDVLLVSHGDSDHRGGLDALLTVFKPVRLISSVPEKLGHEGFELCQKGQSWRWDGVDFTMLHPFSGWKKSSNNNSCVLKVSNDHGSILIPGDIEKVAEAELIESQQNISATVLLVPHHGSNTSSTGEFLKRVNPKMAIVTTGYLNRFGFPKENVMQRYAAQQIKVLNTASSGMISLTFKDEELPVFEQFRDRAPHFWQTKGEIGAE